MPIPAPNLDDRDLEQLLAEATSLVKNRISNWDETYSNPGQALLEVFAHLTEALLYRLNRLPDKAYIQFLNLIGTRLIPPTAAAVRLKFSLAKPAEQDVRIPQATRVSVERSESGGEPPVFITDQAVTIAAGQTDVEVDAHHCDWVAGELAGVGSGLPGQSLRLERPPLVQRLNDGYDLWVGVELLPDEPGDPAKVEELDGKRYLKWDEVEAFTLKDDDAAVFNVDRVEGRVYFGSGEHGRVPQAGREIRAWYRRGGGASGNVGRGTLSVPKDTPPGFNGTVTNPEPASGGRDAESLESALQRGPRQLHSLERAVTGRDFELLALSSGEDIARAWPFARAEAWCFGQPGEVEVLLVPNLPAGPLTQAALVEQQNEETRQKIQQDLDNRRTMGVVCRVNWTRYKPVRVRARLVVNRYADPQEVREQVIARLNQAINPLPSEAGGGWSYGQALHASRVYQICQQEPGVRYVDGVVKFLVDETPGQDVNDLVADPFQPGTWYAASGDAVFRSQDDGDGWVKVCSFDGEKVLRVVAHPQLPGRLAFLTYARDNNKASTHLYLSDDCGESCINPKRGFSSLAFDAAWVTRAGSDYLLIAGSEGLLEVQASPQKNYPEAKIIVASDAPQMACRAIAVTYDDRGLVTVAVASDEKKGVYLSSDGGRNFSLHATGLEGKDIYFLAIHRTADQRQYLWAGIGAQPGANGEGCYRWELQGGQKPADGWKAFSGSWSGGSCTALAFFGSQVAAGSYTRGVLRLDPDQASPAWKLVDPACGLPRKTGNDLESITALDFRSDEAGAYLLAGTGKGVFRTADGDSYACVSLGELLDKVTLPPTRLFCAGQHDITAELEK